MWTAFTETLRFIVVPLVLVDLVTSHYPQLATAFLDNINSYIIFFGGMIVASSTLEAINRPGTYKRMLFGLTALAFLCLWIFVIFGGGVAEVKFGPYFIRFDMSKIVYIILLGVSLKGLLVVSTFTAGRKFEEQRARKRRLERVKARRVPETTVQPRPHPHQTKPVFMFANFEKTEFEVTADDLVGYAPSPPERPVPKGMKVCEICGVNAPTKDYVCRNCGAWFPRESVE